MTSDARRQHGLQLLLRVLRNRGDLAALTPAEWDALLPAAEHAKLSGRLAADAEHLGLADGLPDWARDRLTSSRIRGNEFERLVRWEIDRIHRALLPIGVRPVFLKGAGYAAAGLPCAVGRVVADVDVLVAEIELSRVQAALQQYGWQFEPLDSYDERYYREWMHELPPLRHQERGTMLDVHHRILPRTGRIHPPTERLLEKAVEIGGTRVLSPEHMVLHSAAHLFQDGEVAGALRDVVDLHDLLTTFGDEPGFWEALAAEAKALGLGRPLFYAVRYARLVGCDIKFPGVDAWRPGPALLALMDRLVGQTLMGRAGALESLGVFALYARSHWLKMPTGLLLRHLSRKATSRFWPQTSKKG